MKRQRRDASARRSAAYGGGQPRPKNAAAAGAEVARSKPICVEVRNVAGEELRLELDRANTVRALKQRLADHWAKSPPICQRLLFGGAEVASDGETLGALLPKSPPKEADSGFAAAEAANNPSVPGYGGDLQGRQDAQQSLRLMMVVSLENAQNGLGNASAKVRVEALEAMAIVAPRSNRGASAAISALLADEASIVRTAALEALSKVLPQGDDRARAAALKQLAEDSDALVRRAAVELVTGMLPEGCRPGIATLGKSLADQDQSVVKEVKNSLIHLCQRSSADAGVVVEALRDALAHSRSEVRLAALQTLVSIGPAKAAASLESLLRLLEDRDKHVKQEAQLALVQLAPEPRMRALLSARARLLYGNGSAKLGAMKELSRDAPMGDAGVIAAVCSSCKDRKTRGLAIEALKALVSLAPPGNLAAMSCIYSCISEDRPEELRLAALKVLPRMARVRDPEAIAAVSDLQDHVALGQEASAALRLLLQETDYSNRSAQRALGAAEETSGALNRDAPTPSRKVQLPPLGQSQSQHLQQPFLGGGSCGGLRKSCSESVLRPVGELGRDAARKNPLLAAALGMVSAGKSEPAWRIQRCY